MAQTSSRPGRTPRVLPAPYIRRLALFGSTLKGTAASPTGPDPLVGSSRQRALLHKLALKRSYPLCWQLGPADRRGSQPLFPRRGQKRTAETQYALEECDTRPTYDRGAWKPSKASSLTPSARRSRQRQDAPVRVGPSDCSLEAQAAMPSAPWASVVAMRHRLVHALTDIDRAILWKTATEFRRCLFCARLKD